MPAGQDSFVNQESRAVMTAEMIEWTFLLLEWIKGRVPEVWPDSKFRGNSPELDPDGYSIRFRENGDEYWMVITPEVIQRVALEQVTKLLEAEDWIAHIKRTGCLHLGLKPGKEDRPELHPCPYTT